MNILTKRCNPANYGTSRNLTVVDWIVIHYTENWGDTAANNATYFAREALKSPASAHFFVDETEIWASVPLGKSAYHCGSSHGYKHPGCRNMNSIGVEICMNATDGSIRHESIRHAQRLVRALMAQFDIPVSHVLRHYDVTGKNCPAPMVKDPALWEKFKKGLDEIDMTEKEVREIVRDEINKFFVCAAEAPAHDYSKNAITELRAVGVTDGQRPQAYMTREEGITLAYRIMQRFMRVE